MRVLVRPACMLLVLSACASASGAGVPKLNPERLVAVSFTPLVPRQLDLALADGRAPRPVTSAATVGELERAMRAVMTRAGVTVESGARNRLALTLGYPDEEPANFSREDCIELSGRLFLGDESEAYATAVSCFAETHVSGFRVGSDASAVFEQVLNIVLKSLDESLEKYAGR